MGAGWVTRPTLLHHSFENHPSVAPCSCQPSLFHAHRAKALLVVVGNPKVLCHDFSWREFLRYVRHNQGHTGSVGIPSEEVLASMDTGSRCVRERMFERALQGALALPSGVCWLPPPCVFSFPPLPPLNLSRSSLPLRDDQLRVEMADIARRAGLAQGTEEEAEEELAALQSTIPLEGGEMVRHE